MQAHPLSLGATSTQSPSMHCRAADPVNPSDGADTSCRKSRLIGNRGLTAADLDAGIDYFAVQGRADRARLEGLRA